MYKRYLDLPSLTQERSLFLLGPRQTGKSTLLKTQFPEALVINLLEADTFRELSTRPETLRHRIEAQRKTLIVIDEIQRVPELLNEVHNLIEKNKARKFILTGSSARSLKRKGVNLLGGRALSAHLYPLVSWELDFKHLEETLLWGSLPAIVDSKMKKEDLKAYVGTYLQEEIRAESLVRNLAGFSRFLEVAALCSGQQLRYSAVGSDARVNERTVKDYFQILSDTFLGKELSPFRKGKTRKSVSSSKFYYFDNGVWNALLGRFSLSDKTREFGEALEHLIFHELNAYLDYKRSDESLSYWRAQKQEAEVDFIIGSSVAIEVKGSSRIDKKDTKGLDFFSEEVKLKRKIIVCNESTPRTLDNGIEIIPYTLFCQQLWADEIINP